MAKNASKTNLFSDGALPFPTYKIFGKLLTSLSLRFLIREMGVVTVSALQSCEGSMRSAVVEPRGDLSLTGTNHHQLS